ncbi:MAG: bifunctional UDP-N-acetylglucosamine diphosphorylase/glucosamine-1-phosphate N-acetyltransferase GlmU [Acidobacteria bacterium]|nr:bifunctional UDP-N-acetylglucosamine diphosphorylase/glucosamine-1-phosphate N-acetyltransferase GlmU [Acidobacteriota bacterium]
MTAKPGDPRGPNHPPRSDALAAVILAAGEGTRMKSRRAKVLHEIAGRPLVEHVAAAAAACGARPLVVVVGAGADEVRSRLSATGAGEILFVEQPQRLGTADAVRRAAPALGEFTGSALILCGDVPALPAEALRALAAAHAERGAALTVLTAELDDPSGYGRVVRGASGAVQAIVEHRDATPDQRAIREINTGTYCADWRRLLAAIEDIRPDNSQGEYYLTDAVRLMLARGWPVAAVIHPRPDEALGINSRRQLAQLARLMNRRILERWMDAGVTILDPETTWIHDTVEIGPDTVLHPGVTLEGATRIGRECVVRSGARLSGVTLGDGSEVLDHSVATDSEIGPHCKVGPFAHLRPGTRLGPDCKVGNFVETKKAVLGPGTKASHLSYLGDAQIGGGCNIGAGTITCNYDGERKNVTVLEDGVFIGSDTQLVAPVKVGRGAYVAAGSTIVEDVPPGALGIARGRQANIEGWVEKKKKGR